MSPLPEVFLAAQLLGASGSDEEASFVDYADAHEDIQSSPYFAPSIPSEKCEVDLSNYPKVDIVWPQEHSGPLYRAKTETELLIAQTLSDWEANGLEPETSLATHDGDFTLDQKERFRQVDVVFVVDRSGTVTEDQTNDHIQAVISQVPGRKQQKVIYYDGERIYTDYSSTQNSGWSRRGRAFRYRLPSRRSYGLVQEEMHIQAMEKALRQLEKIPGRQSHSQHIVLLTDEGNKRDADRIPDLVKSASAAKVKIHVLYDPSQVDRQGKPEQFKELKDIATATGGTKAELRQGTKPPDIFSEDLTSWRFAVVYGVQVFRPYEPGVRHFEIANGEGAACEFTVDLETIERAIEDERLKDQTSIDGLAVNQKSEGTLAEALAPGVSENNALGVWLLSLLALFRRKNKTADQNSG